MQINPFNLIQRTHWAMPEKEKLAIKIIIFFENYFVINFFKNSQALYSLKRYKEALKCYEDGLKFADQNHAGLRRLIEVITQEMQGTTITSSIGCSTNQGYHSFFTFTSPFPFYLFFFCDFVISLWDRR